MAKEYSLFRIRREFDPAADKAYAAHLRRVRGKVPRDMYRYFAEDFFHDGGIELVSYDGLRRRLELVVGAPNIRQRQIANWVYASVDYRCVFEGVDSLQVLCKYPSDPANLRRKWSWEYLHGELETVTRNPAAIKRPGGRFHSLVIEAMEGWMEIVFLRLKVEPVNKQRVSTMRRARGRYYFPFPANKPPAWAAWDRGIRR